MLPNFWQSEKHDKNYKPEIFLQFNWHCVLYLELVLEASVQTILHTYGRVSI